MPKVTLIVDPEMVIVLKRRAKDNRRSLVQEINYLIEVALASELSVDIGFIRNWLLANGGVKSLAEKSDNPPTPAGMGELQPATSVV